MSVLASFQMLGKDKNQALLLIAASFVLAYSVRDSHAINKRQMRCFAKFNGVYNAWPYWREFVQNMVGRMGLPPLTVPVFRIAGPRAASRE